MSSTSSLTTYAAVTSASSAELHTSSRTTTTSPASSSLSSAATSSVSTTLSNTATERKPTSKEKLTITASANGNAVTVGGSIAMQMSDSPNAVMIATAESVTVTQHIHNPPITTDISAWNLPLANDKWFTGREKELKQLKEILIKKNSLPIVISAISGLGGVGKTQLATYYIYHPEQKYELRLWFCADNATILYSNYIRFCRELKLIASIQGEEKLEKEDVLFAFNHYLQKHPNYIAVYDNAGSYSEIEALLPKQGGHIIITTRLQEYHDLGSKIEVDVFSEPEALQYLKKVIQRDEKELATEDKALKALAAKLGYLPLALAQAGAYIKRQKIAVADYLDRYEKNAKERLEDATLPKYSKQDPVAITWNISLKAIHEDEAKAKESKISVEVLRAMSYLHPNQIPRSLLEIWLEEKKVAKKSEAKIYLDNAIGHLTDYSMIQATPQTLSVHCLVQEVVRLPIMVEVDTKVEAKSEKKAEKIGSVNLEAISYLKSLIISLAKELKACVDRSIRFIGEEYKSQECKVYQDEVDLILKFHIQELVKYTDQYQAMVPKLSEMLSESFNYLICVTSCVLADIAKSDQYKCGGNVDAADILRIMSDKCGENGDIRLQRSLLKKALTICKKHYKKHHPDIAIIQSKLAHVYLRLKEIEKATFYSQEALKIFTKYYGPNNRYTLEAQELFFNVCKVRQKNVQDVLGQQEILSLLQNNNFLTVRFYFEECGENLWDLKIHKQIIDHYLGQQNLFGAVVHSEVMLNLMEETKKTDKNMITGIHHNVGCYYHSYANQQKASGETKKAEEAIEKAKQHFLQGIALSPHPGIRTEYANFLLRQDGVAAAIEQLEIVLKDNSETGLSYGMLDRSTLDKTLQAELDYWQKIEVNAIPLAHYLLITAYCRQNNLKAAKKLLTAFNNIAIKEQNPLIVSLLGAAQMLVKDYASAMASYQKALQLKPDYTVANRNLASLALNAAALVYPKEVAEIAAKIRVKKEIKESNSSSASLLSSTASIFASASTSVTETRAPSNSQSTSSITSATIATNSSRVSSSSIHANASSSSIQSDGDDEELQLAIKMSLGRL